MIRALAILLLFSGSLFPVATLVAGAPVSADKIKVAYIYQFTQFVTWPDTASSIDQEFSVCVFGNDPIAKELEPLTRRQVNGQSITVRYPEKIQETDSCNILYIAETKKHLLRKLFKYLHDKPVLTVSSIPDFAMNGGIIDFVIRNNKVRLETNVAVARHANLSISAKLLEVCLQVYGLEKGKG